MRVREIERGEEIEYRERKIEKVTTDERVYTTLIEDSLIGSKTGRKGSHRPFSLAAFV